MQKLNDPRTSFWQKVLTCLSRLALFLAFLDFLFMGYLIVRGFPARPVSYFGLHLKNVGKPFIALIVLILGSLILHSDRKQKIKTWKGRIEAFASKPLSLWVLFAFYGILFLWQQLAEYFAIEINFIPFGFFDYMLYYLFQGKVNFTGWLHGYYHLNNIMILLAPFWYFFKNSLFLVVIYGFVAAAAIFPLAGIINKKFPEKPVVAFLVALVYLNYRYLQNLLQVNFVVEVFYPLLIFSTLYCAMSKQWFRYYLFLILGLAIKEDSFLYFSALGVLVFFVAKPRRHGIAAVAISFAYLFFLLKLFIPFTHNTILTGDIKNFRSHGTTPGEIVSTVLGAPQVALQVLFGTPAKLKTWLNLLSRFLFIPLCTPSVLLIAIPLFPLFLNGGENFVDLRFHYAGAVIPFAFIAFIFGFSNLYHWLKGRSKEIFIWTLSLALLLIHGGHYSTQQINPEDRKSIEWAQSIPLSANVVTQGHLLPYLGYRSNNFYFAPAFDVSTHPLYSIYSKPEYYLIDFNVDFYPLDRTFFEKQILRLKNSPDYELQRQDGIRYLFRKK